MSRIGNKAIEIPAGVTVTQQGNTVTVKGPKGELTSTFNEMIGIKIDGNTVTFTRPNEEKFTKSIHGTTRALVNNMVVGVSEGFMKELDLVGVGYRAQLQGNKLVLNVGYSHPVEFTPEDGIEVEVPTNTKIIVKGYDKAHQSLTKVKVSNTLTKSSVVKKVRQVNNSPLLLLAS